MAYSPLTFHRRCGGNVRVIEDGMKVEKTGELLSGWGGALTARPLRTQEALTVQISSRPSLNFGVTTHSPETLEFPVHMYQLRGTWCLQCGDRGFIIVNTKLVNTQFLSMAALDALKEGDTLGLMVTKDRNLVFYVNGKSVGVAATEIPSKVYGFVDLLFPSFPAVRLIPDVQEEQRHLVAYEKAVRAKGRLALTIMHGMINGPPRVGKSSLLARLFGANASAISQPDLAATVATTEMSSTGVAERIVQISVKRSTTLHGSAANPGMKWELQTLDDEAIALLKAIVRTVPMQDEASSTIHASIREQPQLSELISAFKQRLIQTPTTHQPSLPIGGPSSPERSKREDDGDSTSAIPGLKAPIDIFREAFRNQQVTIETLLEGSFTICLTDTGGQLEFQEILAALIAGPSVFFLVFKLNEDLNEKLTVQYVGAGSKKSQPYISHFTVKEVLLQSLASIACTCAYIRQSSSDMELIRPKVVLVGTHKDLASKQQIQAIQQEVKEMLQDTDYHRDNIVEYASMDEPVVTVNNLHPEGQDMQKVRDIIKRIAEDPAFQVCIPFLWLVLSLLLRHLTEPVITYQQCLSVASECGITSPEDLDEALWFLHTKLGVIRYFKSIPELRDIVILDPQILFTKITNLITSTFTFESTTPYTVETFQQKGIFSLQVIDALTATSKELLTTSRLVKLLEHLHIIAPIRDERTVEYFMPCVLAHATPGPVEPTASQQIPPLLVTFQCGYCPKGLFSALVACLLSKVKVRGTTWRLKKDGMARDQVTFHVGRESHAVAIMTKLTHLEVLLQPTPLPSYQKPTSLEVICNTVRESIGECITAVCKTLRYSLDSTYDYGFYCNHKSCIRSKKHLAICHDNHPCVAECCKTGGVEPLTSNQCLWFGQPLPSVSPEQHRPGAVAEETGRCESIDVRPTLKQLQVLRWSEGGKRRETRVMKTVASRWRDVGIAFGLDGSDLSSIESTCLKDARHCTEHVMTTWLEKGDGHTWERLLDALEDAEFSNLATELRNALSTLRT